MLTSLDFLSPGQVWPPKSEEDRLNMYAQNKLLFKGKHEKIFKEWIKLLREDQKAVLLLILNWNKRLSLLWADLLLGEPPYISAGDSVGQSIVDRYIERGFFNTCYEVAIDISRFGHGVFKARYNGSEAIIEGQPPEYWFPVFSFDNAKEIVAHVFAWAYKSTEKVVLGGLRTKEYLKCEIHEPGKITTRTYEISNGKIRRQTEKDSVVDTGIKEMPIVVISGVSTTDNLLGFDDYSDLDSIIQELEIRIAQVSKILDKHADPNMYGPDTALEEDPKTGEVMYKGGGKYFPVAEGEQPPGYVTWNGQLEAAFKQIEVLMEQLYFLSETSPAAFGQLKSGLAESGSALRRLMLAPLSKVNRIRLKFDPGLRKILCLASELEVANGTANSTKLDEINVEWYDGLPQDDTELVTNESIAYSSGFTSLESSLKRVYGLRGKALQEELEKIKEERMVEPEIQLNLAE